MQVGDCLAHVRYARSDLYAVILVSTETTPCLQRRQVLRMLANEETSSTPLSDAVTRVIQGIKVPAEGPVPLVLLSRFGRIQIGTRFILYSLLCQVTSRINIV